MDDENKESNIVEEVEFPLNEEKTEEIPVIEHRSHPRNGHNKNYYRQI